MREIKDFNVDAFKHLMQILPRHVLNIIFIQLSHCLLFLMPFILFGSRSWSRSRFTSRPTCDIVVNNMSKGFNNIIVDARSKPIITMMEEI